MYVDASQGSRIYADLAAKGSSPETGRGATRKSASRGGLSSRVDAYASGVDVRGSSGVASTGATAAGTTDAHSGSRLTRTSMDLRLGKFAIRYSSQDIRIDERELRAMAARRLHAEQSAAASQPEDPATRRAFQAYAQAGQRSATYEETARSLLAVV